MSYYTCPKCGNGFHSKGDRARVNCHRCGTSWNTGSVYSGGDGCGTLIFWFIVIVVIMKSCGGGQ
jgi:uncharacterized protein (DUF983 family)